ncbi:MAG: hypoxanthine phosphoribosyltransferase [Actinobacteria bacterium]|nr:MAG: hypoxanthine phosphoribosyltransferase [Actinomycetota bacterium]
MEMDFCQRILLEAETISARVAELGARISQDYEGRSPLAVGILRGAIVFLADLVREMSVPVELDFMAVSSYGKDTKTSGVVRILKDLDQDIKGRDVLLVEDILDTGLTLDYLVGYLSAREPASLEVCVLLNKQCEKKIETSVKYRGFDVPDEFVVGYGLDHGERYRNLPFVCTLKPEVYQGK